MASGTAWHCEVFFQTTVFSSQLGYAALFLHASNLSAIVTLQEIQSEIIDIPGL